MSANCYKKFSCPQLREELDLYGLRQHRERTSKTTPDIKLVVYPKHRRDPTARELQVVNHALQQADQSVHRSCLHHRMPVYWHPFLSEPRFAEKATKKPFVFDPGSNSRASWIRRRVSASTARILVKTPFVDVKATTRPIRPCGV
mmetsp:Transcript_28412/g.111457  ORF Transcript_28412/g.111457 Transcript_28412/m.111457 type:complete len:145 (-) Transcript_28412:563-997(-)